MLILKRFRFLVYLGLVVVFLLMAQISMSENNNSETEKYGLIDKMGKYLVLPEFDYIDDFSEGLALVGVDGKTGYIDKTGKMVIPLQVDGGNSKFLEGLATAKLKGNDKLGYIDKTGKVVIPPQFDKASDFNEGMAAVVVNQKYGYINKLGSYVIRPQFEFGSTFYQNRALVEAQQSSDPESYVKYGLIDQTGNYIVKPTFDQMNNTDSYGQLYSLPEFKEGRMRVGMGGWPCHMAMGFAGVKWGYIDPTGKVVIPMKFTMTEQFYNGRARVSLSPIKCEDSDYIKWGYINLLGEYVTSLQFDDAKNFYEGLAIVRLGKKWGYIDLSGKFVISPQFNEDISEFHEGLAVASNKNGLYGYIDKTGKFVIAPQFDSSYDFLDGTATVEVNDKRGLIDKTGKYIIEPKYDGISRFYEGLAAVKVNEKWGYVDNTGKVVIELKFASFGNFSQGVARVSVKQKL